MFTGGFPWRYLAQPGVRVQAKVREFEQKGGVAFIASAAAAASTSVSMRLYLSSPCIELDWAEPMRGQLMSEKCRVVSCGISGEQTCSQAAALQIL